MVCTRACAAARQRSSRHTRPVHDWPRGFSQERSPASLLRAQWRLCILGRTMLSRGTTQQSSAPYNRRIVLDVIRRRGRISRREIVALVSLSPQTVANITNELETLGLIVARRATGAK